MQNEDDMTLGDWTGVLLLLVCAGAIAPYAWRGLWLLIRIGWAWYCFGR
jgi:hypothetical protein